MDTNGTIDLKPGEALFSVGDLSDSVYLVMSGSLFVEPLSSAKGPTIISAGDVVGESALLGYSKRIATVRAETPVVVKRILNTSVKELVHAHAHLELLVRAILLELTWWNFCRDKESSPESYGKMALEEQFQKILHKRQVSETFRTQLDLEKVWTRGCAVIVENTSGHIQCNGRRVPICEGSVLGACDLILDQKPGQVLVLSDDAPPIIGRLIEISDANSSFQQINKGIAAVIRRVADKTSQARQQAASSF